jgi:hypothetical protein
MRQNEDFGSPAKFIDEVARQRAQRELVNNAWNKFSSWVAPKVNKGYNFVKENPFPLPAAYVATNLIDPEDGLAKRGLDVIDKALSSKDPEYKGKLLDDIVDKTGISAITETPGQSTMTVGGGRFGVRVKQVENQQLVEQGIIEDQSANTWLSENVYDPAHQAVGYAFLASNPDTKEEAARRGMDPLALAWEERENISPGQAAWDLVAGDYAPAFGAINIYDEAQRQELFYGDGFVSNVARGGSGAIDLTVQIVADPLNILAGAGTIGRAATTSARLTAGAAKGAKRAFEKESFFRGGVDDIKLYSEQRGAYDAKYAQLEEIEQNELLLQYRTGSATDEMNSLPLNDPQRVALKQSIEENQNKILELRTQRDELLSAPDAMPTLSPGIDEFFNQILTTIPRASQIFEHDYLRVFGAGRDRVAAALELAARTGDKRDLIDVYLVASQIDPEASGRLIARRDSLVSIINDRRSQMKELTAEIANLVDDSPATAAALKEARDSQAQVFKALMKEDKYLAAAVAKEEQRAPSAMSRLTTAPTVKIPEFIPGAEEITRSIEKYRALKAKNRATIAMDRRTIGTEYSMQEFRISPLARPVYVAQWVGGHFGRFHTSNTVAIDGLGASDAPDEVIAWIQNAPLWGKSPMLNRATVKGEKVTPQTTADKRQKLLDKLISATTRYEKEKVLREMEDAYTSDVAAYLGYSREEGEVMKGLFLENHAQEIDLLRQPQGFYPDRVTGKLVSNPKIASELEYRYYMIDASDFYKFALIEKDAMQPVIRLALDIDKTPAQVIDMVKRTFRGAESVWKYGVLVRLGYPVRNVGTEWLKFPIADGGGLTGYLFSDMGKETLRNMAANTFSWWDRQSMRFEKARGMQEATFNETVPSLDASADQIRKLPKLGGISIKFPEYEDYVAFNNQKRMGKVNWLKAEIEDLKSSDGPLLPDEEVTIAHYESEIARIENDVATSENRLSVLAERAEKSQKVRSGQKPIYVNKNLWEAPFDGSIDFAFREALSTASATMLQTTALDSLALSGSKLSKGYIQVYPGDKEYYPNLADLINKRWSKDNTSKILLTGIDADEMEFLLKKPGALRDAFIATGNRKLYAKEIAKEKAELKQAQKDSLFTDEQLAELAPPVSAERRYAEEMIGIVDDLFPSQEIRDRILAMSPSEKISINELRKLYDDLGGSIKKPIIAGRVDEKTLKIRSDPQKDVIKKDKDGNPVLDSRGNPIKERVDKEGAELARAEEANTLYKTLNHKSKPATISGAFRKMGNKTFEWIGVRPEDKLVSSPFGQMVYQKHIQEVQDAWDAAGFTNPTGADIYAATRAARERAVQESKRYLYRTNRRLKGVGNIPFVSSFLQAGILGLKSWGRIAWQNPTTLTRKVWLWDYINQHADLDERNDRRYLTFTLPDFLIENINALPGDQAYLKNVLRAYNKLSFSTQSLNLILPGIRGEGGFEQVISTLGIGPAISVPASEYLKGHPYIDQEILDRTGAGIPTLDIMGQIVNRQMLESLVPAETLTNDPSWYQGLPPWTKRAIAIYQKEDSAEFARTQMYLLMWHLHRQHPDVAEEPPVKNVEEFQKLVDDTAKEAAIHLAIRLASNLLLPAVPAWSNSEMAPMINLWNTYQEKYKENAFPMFIDEHPEWFSVTMSLSEGDTGIRATSDAAYMANKHRDLIDQVTTLGGSDTSADAFIQMIVNRDDRPNVYDPAARIWQLQNEYGIENKTYRGQKTPKGAAISLDEKLGWKTYMDVKAARDYKLYELGMEYGLDKPATPNMKISEEVMTDFNNWVDAQQTQNPTWYRAYETGGAENVSTIAVQAGRIVLNNKKWLEDQAGNPWVDLMQDYIDLRDGMAEYLATTSDDEDTISEQKTNFYDMVNDMKSQNTQWAYYYDRFFDGDKLERIN